jgi:aldose 1-epimerase
VLDHVLMIRASRYTPTDDTLIPTGEIASVEGTPLDFRRPARMGERIEQLFQTAAMGYDHNFVFDEQDVELPEVARLSDPKSGLVMTVSTTEPGVQLYSGNFLRGQLGKRGKTYAKRSAVCLETQHFPDSVNHANFPSTVLRPGQVFRSTTVYAFFAE